MEQINLRLKKAFKKQLEEITSVLRDKEFLVNQAESTLVGVCYDINFQIRVSEQYISRSSKAFIILILSDEGDEIIEEAVTFCPYDEDEELVKLKLFQEVYKQFLTSGFFEEEEKI